MEEKKEEVKQEGDFKIKKKPGRPKKLTNKKETTTPKIEIKKEDQADPVVINANEDKEKETSIVEEPKQESSKEEVKAEENTIQEIEKTETPVKEAVIAERNPLPENVNKLVSFMNETGGNLEDMKAAMRATSQVFSKGKVSAEELRQQLGERLPGAFTLFAASMDKTPAELDKALEQGKVTLDDFMKFAKKLFATEPWYNEVSEYHIVISRRFHISIVYS